MAVLATLELDGLGEGANVDGSLGGNWSCIGVGSTFAALAAAAAHGARGVRLTNSGNYRQFQYAEATSARRIYDYYFKPTAVAANLYLGTILNGATNQANWRINTNMTVTLRNGLVAVQTSGVALTIGTWYRASWDIDGANQTLTVYEGESSTALITLTGAISSATRDVVAIGLTAAASGCTFDMDTLRVADAPVDAFAGGGPDPDPSGDDPLVTRNFDLYTEGQSVDFTDGNWSSAGTNSTFTALAAAAVHGDRGLRLVNSGNYRRIGYASTTGTRVLDFYARITAVPNILYLGLVLDSATVRANFRINVDRTVSLRDGTTLSVTSTQVLSLNTVYRFAWRIEAGQQILRVYEGDYEVPDFTLTAPVSSSARTIITVGLTSASTGAEFDLDTVRTATDWLTPYAPAGLPPGLANLDFEEYADGQTLSLSSPWARNGTPPFVAEADAAVHGDMGARLANSSGYSQLEYNETTSATRSYDLFLTLRQVSNAFYCGAIFNGSTVIATWRVNVDRTISLRDHNNVVVTTSAQALALDTTYRVAWRITSGSQELRVFQSNATTLFFSLTGAAGTGQRTAWRFGVTGASAGNTVDVDTIRVGADWLAPLAGSTAPTDSQPFILDLTDNHKMGVTALTGTISPTPARNLAHIGDSLTADQGSPSLTVTQSYQANSNWSTIYVDGEIGRPIVGTVGGTAMETVIDNWRAQGINPRDWVIALGSNNVGATDANWITWIGQALDHIAVYEDPSGEYGPTVGDYNVYWPGITFRDSVNDSRATRFWSVLQGITPPQGVNFIPLNLNSSLHAVTTAADWNQGDTSGRHMTTAGYAKRNQVLANLVGAPLPL